MLRKWLPLREEILAFSQAPAAHGGSGAVLLLLKSSVRFVQEPAVKSIQR